MLNQIFDKIRKVKRSQGQMWMNGNFTFFRLFIMLKSRTGQKKTLKFIIKVIQFILQLVFGIKTKETKDYELWMKKNYPDEQKLNQYKNELSSFSFQPKISIILPVYNTPINYLIEALDSVINQIYPNWELCISDDCSTDNMIREMIIEYAANDNRIKYVFRDVNGHISLNSNSALEIATGDYITFLDHDDKLSLDALFQNVKILNNNREIDFIYSDEDKIDKKGHHFAPHFKPDWCPDNLLSRNYICHLVVVKKSLIDQVGGFRAGFEGSQDYDLLLRLTEIAKIIYHIPKILYHWRLHSESTSSNIDAKPYAFNSGELALQKAIERRGIKGKVNLIKNSHGFYTIRYDIFNKGKVSVIIPTKDKADLCEVIIESIFRLTSYPDFEIILINNNSSEQSFFDFVKKWEEKEPERFKCIHDNDVFNYSRLINNGAKVAKGEYFLLLNNDMEVIHEDWMTALVEYAQFETSGAVGARLIYPNDTIQHAGVIIGLGGIAGHHHVMFDKDAPGYYFYLIATSNFSAVTAACIMINKKKFNEVEGFDEKLAVEFNDVDFCLKLKEKGYNNIYLPHVTLYHYESISRGHPHLTKKSYQQHLKDVNLFKSRWQKYIDNDPCYNPNLSKISSEYKVNLDD